MAYPIGSGAAFSANGAYRCERLPGVGVTTTWSIRGSVMHRSLGRPSPSRSFIATPAPTDEIQASICL